MFYSSNFTLKVALRYFIAKKRERLVSFIAKVSLIGIAIGVAALIIVMSIMNGFRSELVKNLIGLNSDITVLPPHGDLKIDNYNDLVAKISSQKFIKKAIPIVTGEALAVGRKGNAGVGVKAIRLEDLKYKSQISNNIIYGDIENLAEDNSVAIGSELAFTLGLRVGDNIKLISSQANKTIIGSIPKAKTYKVTAIFASKFYDYDMLTVLMNLNNGQKYFGMEKTVNTIEIYTDDSSQVLKYTDKLNEYLEERYQIKNWMITHDQFLSALKIERVAMFTILSLIILVAAFNIVSSLFMLVKDKSKDIAILKTLGASPFSIMMIFILNGIFIGFIGTVCGIAVGLLVAYNINTIKGLLEYFMGIKLFDAAVYFLYYLPSEVVVFDVVKVSMLSVFLCLCAALYPSYKAAILNPLDVMRHE